MTATHLCDGHLTSFFYSHISVMKIMPDSALPLRLHAVGQQCRPCHHRRAGGADLHPAHLTRSKNIFNKLKRLQFLSFLLSLHRRNRTDFGIDKATFRVIFR